MSLINQMFLSQDTIPVPVLADDYNLVDLMLILILMLMYELFIYFEY